MQKCVRCFLPNVLHDCFLAEDAVHNAFINLAKHMDGIGKPESLQTKRYLIAIVKNSAIDIYRKKNIHREIYKGSNKTKGETKVMAFAAEGNSGVIPGTGEESFYCFFAFLTVK